MTCLVRRSVLAMTEENPVFVFSTYSCLVQGDFNDCHMRKVNMKIFLTSILHYSHHCPFHFTHILGNWINCIQKKQKFRVPHGHGTNTYRKRLNSVQTCKRTELFHSHLSPLNNWSSKCHSLKLCSCFSDLVLRLYIHEWEQK